MFSSNPQRVELFDACNMGHAHRVNSLLLQNVNLGDHRQFYLNIVNQFRDNELRIKLIRIIIENKNFTALAFEPPIFAHVNTLIALCNAIIHASPGALDPIEKLYDRLQEYDFDVGKTKRFTEHPEEFLQFCMRIISALTKKEAVMKMAKAGIEHAKKHNLVHTEDYRCLVIINAVRGSPLTVHRTKSSASQASSAESVVLPDEKPPLNRVLEEFKEELEDILETLLTDEHHDVFHYFLIVGYLYIFLKDLQLINKQNKEMLDANKQIEELINRLSAFPFDFECRDKNYFIEFAKRAQTLVKLNLSEIISPANPGALVSAVTQLSLSTPQLLLMRLNFICDN